MNINWSLFRPLLVKMYHLWTILAAQVQSVTCFAWQTQKTGVQSFTHSHRPSASAKCRMGWVA